MRILPACKEASASARLALHALCTSHLLSKKRRQFDVGMTIDAAQFETRRRDDHSTVTDFARLRGWSMLHPFASAM